MRLKNIIALLLCALFMYSCAKSSCGHTKGQAKRKKAYYNSFQYRQP